MQAASYLSTAYLNVLLEFGSCSLPILRLIPISGSIFAGKFKKAIFELTAQALHIAECALPSQSRATLTGRRIEMCIFEDKEVEGFKTAIDLRSL